MAAELTDEQIDAAMIEWHAEAVGKSNTGRERMKRAIRAALATQQATQGAEPVAEVCPLFEIRWLGTGPILRLLKRHGIKVGAKLYTAPPPTAEVEKKAARYDWLRSMPLFGAWDVTRARPNREWLIDSLRADELDAAIDAAIQSDQAQAGKENGHDQ